MNNDELKKKIVEVLKPVIRAGNISCNEENACKKCWFPCEIERTAGRLADALIAAGIGDVKEVEKEYRNTMLLAVKSQTLASERSRYMELNKNIAEHRAEVAERALENEIKNRINITGDVEGLVYTYYGRAIYQAEKELAEERKDEN